MRCRSSPQAPLYRRIVLHVGKILSYQAGAYSLRYGLGHQPVEQRSRHTCMDLPELSIFLCVTSSIKSAAYKSCGRNGFGNFNVLCTHLDYYLTCISLNSSSSFLLPNATAFYLTSSNDIAPFLCSNDIFLRFQHRRQERKVLLQVQRVAARPQPPRTDKPRSQEAGQGSPKHQTKHMARKPAAVL